MDEDEDDYYSDSQSNHSTRPLPSTSSERSSSDYQTIKAHAKDIFASILRTRRKITSLSAQVQSQKARYHCDHKKKKNHVNGSKE